MNWKSESQRSQNRCPHLLPLAAMMTFVATVGFACRVQAEPSIPLPQAFYGYYVYASDKDDGSRCKKDESTEELDKGYQMTVTSSEVHYNGTGTHVSCKIQRVYRPQRKRSSPSDGPNYVGSWLRPDDPVYIVGLSCFDEGTTSRSDVMFRLIRMGNSTVLLETDKSLATDAWAKCQGR